MKSLDYDRYIKMNFLDKKICEEFVKMAIPGVKIVETNANYEIIHAIANGVRLIFYPHSTRNNGNHHIRVRNGTPKETDKFKELVILLQKKKPTFDSNFHAKNLHLTAQEGAPYNYD